MPYMGLSMLQRVNSNTSLNFRNANNQNEILRTASLIELATTIHRCQFHVYISPDYRRVFIAGGEFSPPDSGYAREADRLEIEALADRFNSAELRQVLATI